MGSSDGFHPLRVERVCPLGPGMRRVTFAALDAGSLPAERPHGGHCRLRFAGPDARPQARAYTYRRWHPDGRFDVDFAVHAGDGPAARWLRQAGPGARIDWRHGGAPKITLAAPDAGPAFLVADPAGLPVVTALAERARPPRAVSLLLLAPPDITPDLSATRASDAITVQHLASADDVLHHLRRQATAPDALVFAACEAGLMRRVRRLCLDELGLSRGQVVTSGYWKAGLCTEEVDRAKRRADWFGDAPAETPAPRP